MTTTGGAVPRNKIGWLKKLHSRLLDDDADSSDNTPQKKKRTEPKRVDTKAKKKLHMAAEDTTSEGAAVTEQQGGDKSVKQQRRKDKSNSNGEKIHHQGDTTVVAQKKPHHEKRRAPSLGGTNSKREEDRDKTRRRRLDAEKEEPSKMSQRKRPRAEFEAKEKINEPVKAAADQPMDPAKAEAAARRLRRMKKLRARRKATGEHDRLVAVKLKMHESSEVSRLKRNGRVRNAQKPSNAIDVEGNDEGNKEEKKVRAQLGSLTREGTLERKRIAERKRRAAIKAKENGGEMTSVSASALKRPQSAGFDKETRQQRKNGVRGGKAESWQKRRQREQRPSARPSEETGSAGVCVKATESRDTDKEEAENVTTSEGQQGAKDGDINGRGVDNSSITLAAVDKAAIDDNATAVPFTSDNAGVVQNQEQVQEQKASQVAVEKAEVKEEGQVDSPALTKGAPGELVKAQNEDSGIVSKEKKDMQLDLAPIPRKLKSVLIATSTESFVIPKRSVRMRAEQSEARGAISIDNKATGARTPIAGKPRLSPESSPQLSNRDPIRSHKKKTKKSVPVKNAVYSAPDRALMRLARKRNSIFLAAAELAAQPPPGEKKQPATRMAGYEVFDVYGEKNLPDLIPRFSCATKSKIAVDKDSFSSTFFGVSLPAPKAKGEDSSNADESADVEVREMNCYEGLCFERPEDREFYQRRMYGSTFVPQLLREQTTLIMRNARFERKSTGIRFNQDRDREEFAASLSKRYTYNKSVPRCEIRRDNWQALMRNQSSTVYLHYRNREDAERASHVFRDDLGNPLELKVDYSARMDTNRSSGGRIPRRSCSSERNVPEPSPQSSQGGNSHLHWERERYHDANRYSRYDQLPPAQRNGREDRYTSGRRSRSRSRSRSRPNMFPSQQRDSATSGAGGEVGNEATAEKPTGGIHENHPSEVGSGDSQILESGEISSHGLGQAAVPTDQPSPSKAPPTAPMTSARDPEIESGEEQEDGEIENSVLPVTNKTNQDGDDGKGRQWSWSPRSSWQQPHDMQPHQRQEGNRDHSYERQYPRCPRRRSRSRSRPRPESSRRWGRGEYRNFDGPSTTERRHSREFGPVGGYDNNGPDGRREYPNEMGHHRGRDYRDGGCNSNGRMDSRPY